MPPCFICVLWLLYLRVLFFSVLFPFSSIFFFLFNSFYLTSLFSSGFLSSSHFLLLIFSLFSQLLLKFKLLNELSLSWPFLIIPSHSISFLFSYVLISQNSADHPLTCSLDSTISDHIHHVSLSPTHLKNPTTSRRVKSLH